MKLKAGAFIIAACALAMTACSNNQVYWKRTGGNSTASLAPAQANALLNKNLAACNAAIEEMKKTRAVPDPNDLDDCMLGQGWKREGLAPPNPQWMKAETRQYTPPQQQQSAKVYDDRKQIAKDIRHDDLVPVGGQVTLGLQGYQDRYTEPDPGVNVHTNYFGVVAGYLHRDGNHNFWAVDVTAAHGKESYNSPSGVVNGIPDYEADVRFIVGHDYAYGSSWLSPYAGIGGRVFRGNGKGFVSDTGALGYDRRIEQLYAPIGATWRTLLPGQLTMSSTLEGNALLIGHINSRLQNVGGPDLVNTQSFLTGWGVRGEAMLGIPMGENIIEVGPFARYWEVTDSTHNIQTCGGGLCLVYLEPYNKRVQVGLTTRISF